jgi:hypothetical protein
MAAPTYRLIPHWTPRRFIRRFCGEAVLIAATGLLAGGTEFATVQADSTQADHVNPVLYRNFSVLARPRESGDRVPMRAGSRERKRWGLALKEGRRLRTYRGATLFLVPGRRGACLYFRRPASAITSCVPTDAALRGKLITVYSVPGRTLLYGALRTGSGAASLELEGLDGRPLRLTANSYLVSLRANDPRGYVRWRDRKRKPHRVKIPALP